MIQAATSGPVATSIGGQGKLKKVFDNLTQSLSRDTADKLCQQRDTLEERAAARVPSIASAEQTGRKLRIPAICAGVALGVGACLISPLLAWGIPIVAVAAVAPWAVAGARLNKSTQDERNANMCDAQIVGGLESTKNVAARALKKEGLVLHDSSRAAVEQMRKSYDLPLAAWDGKTMDADATVALAALGSRSAALATEQFQSGHAAPYLYTIEAHGNSELDREFAHTIVDIASEGSEKALYTTSLKIAAAGLSGTLAGALTQVVQALPQDQTGLRAQLQARIASLGAAKTES